MDAVGQEQHIYKLTDDFSSPKEANHRHPVRCDGLILSSKGFTLLLQFMELDKQKEPTIEAVHILTGETSFQPAPLALPGHTQAPVSSQILTSRGTLQTPVCIHSQHTCGKARIQEREVLETYRVGFYKDVMCQTLRLPPA